MKVVLIKNGKQCVIKPDLILLCWHIYSCTWNLNNVLELYDELQRQVDDLERERQRLILVERKNKKKGAMQQVIVSLASFEDSLHKTLQIRLQVGAQKN